MTNYQETKLVSKVFKEILKVKRSKVSKSRVNRISKKYDVNPDYINAIGKFKSY